LIDADGEQQETQHWIDTALDCGYWDPATGQQLRQQCEEIGRLLGGMLAKVHTFLDQPDNHLREVPIDYITYHDLTADEE
jgi:hypothetical protein